jgi:hypothetical protein
MGLIAILNPAPVGFDVLGQHFHGGGFACPVGPQESDDLSGLNLKGNPVNGPLGSITL